jgi:hypothetical protein
MLTCRQRLSSDAVAFNAIGKNPMKAQVALLSLFAALAMVAAPAQAKGCLKGAAVGGVGGHFIGHHGLVGAAVGCAVGHHRANKRDAEAQRADNTTNRRLSSRP